MEPQSSSLAQEVTPEKGVFEEGLRRMWVDERWGPGLCGCGLLTLLLPVSTECSSRPEPRAWQHSPQRWDARRPHPAGFLSGMCWAPSGSYAPFTPGQARAGGREGEREREVSSSSVCHGLNTVALCWFKPFPSPSFSPPLPKITEGRKEMESRHLLHGLEFVVFTPTSLHSCPWSGRLLLSLCGAVF